MAENAKHLLLVDDEAALREAIAERLTDHGFTVEQAGSGEEALARLADFAFDVIITDLGCPASTAVRCSTPRSSAIPTSSRSSSRASAP
jgi:DNA-binding response OmpR family regulator